MTALDLNYLQPGQFVVHERETETVMQVFDPEGALGHLVLCQVSSGAIIYRERSKLTLPEPELAPETLAAPKPSRTRRAKRKIAPETQAEPPITGQGANCGEAVERDPEFEEVEEPPAAPTDLPREIMSWDLRPGDRIRVTVEHTLGKHRDNAFDIKGRPGWALGDDVLAMATIVLLEREPEPEPLKEGDVVRVVSVGGTVGNDGFRAFKLERIS